MDLWEPLLSKGLSKSMHLFCGERWYGNQTSMLSVGVESRFACDVTRILIRIMNPLIYLLITGFRFIGLPIINSL